MVSDPLQKVDVGDHICPSYGHLSIYHILPNVQVRVKDGRTSEGYLEKGTQLRTQDCKESAKFFLRVHLYTSF